MEWDSNFELNFRDDLRALGVYSQMLNQTELKKEIKKRMTGYDSTIICHADVQMIDLSWEKFNFLDFIQIISQYANNHSLISSKVVRGVLDDDSCFWIES